MPKKRTGPPPANYNLRVPRDLLEEIRHAAAADGRSVNSFMNIAIRRQLQQLLPDAPIWQPPKPDKPRKRGKKR